MTRNHPPLPSRVKWSAPYLALRKLVSLGSIHHRNWRQTHLLLFVTLFIYVIYRLNFSDQSYRVYSSNGI